LSIGKDCDFRKYVEENSLNPFAVVKQIAAEARRRTETDDHSYTYAQAITWVVQGKEPLYRGSNKTRKSYEEQEVNEQLNYIDDEEVCIAVRHSFKLSMSKRNLVYVYGKIKDEPRKARVRVTTRILWYKLK
jgi:hypothetical protein